MNKIIKKYVDNAPVESTSDFIAFSDYLTANGYQIVKKEEIEIISNLKTDRCAKCGDVEPNHICPETPVKKEEKIGDDPYRYASQGIHKVSTSGTTPETPTLPEIITDVPANLEKRIDSVENVVNKLISYLKAKK